MIISYYICQKFHWLYVPILEKYKEHMFLPSGGLNTSEVWEFINEVRELTNEVWEFTNEVQELINKVRELTNEVQELTNEVREI